MNPSVNDPGNPFSLLHVPEKGQHSKPGPVSGSAGGHRVLLRKRNNIRWAVWRIKSEWQARREEKLQKRKRSSKPWERASDVPDFENMSSKAFYTQLHPDRNGQHLCRGGGWQLSDISWVSYNSAQFLNHLPGDSIRSHWSRPPSHKIAPNPHTGSSLHPVFLSFYRAFITQAWLMKPLAIGGWVNIQPLFLPRRLSRAENSNSLITWWVLLSKGHLIYLTKDALLFRRYQKF